MTSNNRTKTLARRLQTATGDPYATCLARVQHWDIGGLRGKWDQAAFEVVNAELLAATRHAAATLPDGTVTVTLDPTGAHPSTDPAILVTVPGLPESVCLDIAAMDGYLGYIWRTETNPVYVMANFLGADGKTLTSRHLLTSHATDLPRITEAITWLVTQFAAHPDRYEDTGRPTIIEDPIFD